MVPILRILAVSLAMLPFDLLSCWLEVRLLKNGRGASGFGIIMHLFCAPMILFVPLLTHALDRAGALALDTRFLGVLLMFGWHYLLVGQLPRLLIPDHKAG